MIKLVSLYVISVKVIVSKSLSLTLSKDLPYLFHRYGNWDWKKFFIPQVTQLLLANLTSEHQSVWLYSLWMCPLYTHCLNSIHQSHYPFNLYPLVLTLTVTVCPQSSLPQDEKFCSRGWSPAWQKWCYQCQRRRGGTGLQGCWEHRQCPLCLKLLQSHYCWGSKSVISSSILGPAAALPGNLLEMQTLGPNARPTELETEAEAQQLCFDKGSRWFQYS